MPRQTILTAIFLSLACLFSCVHANEEQTDDTASQFTTIHTVVWVGGDVDEYLTEEEEGYWNRQVAYTTEILGGKTDFSELEWSSLQLSSLDYQAIDPPIDFEVTSANWFAENDFFQLSAPSLISLGHLDIATMPPGDPMFLIDFLDPSAVSLANPTEPAAASLSDWPSTLGQSLAAIESNQSATLTAAPPVMAAIVPPTTDAETAGLWFFLGIMIAPFAWLGWQEYQELKSRSRHAIDQSEEEREDEQLEQELDSIQTSEREEATEEAAEETEQELVADAVEEESEMGEEIVAEEDIAEEEFSDVAAATEDDCEYELGVLEDANALLATAGQANRESSDEPTREAFDEQANSTDGYSDLEDDGSLDLTTLRGVGKVTRDYLVSKGIRSVSDLEDAGAKRIQEILDEAGAKFQTANPEKWIKQARDILATSR